MLGFSSWWQPVAVFAAAMAAGAANAIAGGGSALSFPILVFVGVPPVAANATNAVGLWPGSAAAAWSYRSRIRSMKPRTRWLVLPAVGGGLLGGWLLINLPQQWFATLAPFLVLGAAASVGVEPLVERWVGSGEIRKSNTALVGGLAATLGVAVYGGYFGAGMGMLLLTSLGLMGLDELQHANAVKNFLAMLIKLPAIVYFMVLGKPVWHASAIMWVGAISGGWLAGHFVQQVNAERLRWAIVAMGIGMAVFMFLD